MVSIRPEACLMLAVVVLVALHTTGRNHIAGSHLARMGSLASRYYPARSVDACSGLSRPGSALGGVAALIGFLIRSRGIAGAAWPV